MYTFHKTSRNKVLRNEALLHRDTPKYSQSKTGNKSKKYLTPSQKLTLQKKGKKKSFQHKHSSVNYAADLLQIPARCNPQTEGRGGIKVVGSEVLRQRGAPSSNR